jgi:hypothetical protein
LKLVVWRYGLSAFAQAPILPGWFTAQHRYRYVNTCTRLCTNWVENAADSISPRLSSSALLFFIQRD